MSVGFLIVDDAPEFRTLLRIVLELEDEFEVVGEAETAAAAIGITESARPDCILRDLEMAPPSAAAGMEGA